MLIPAYLISTGKVEEYFKALVLGNEANDLLFGKKVMSRSTIKYILIIMLFTHDFRDSNSNSSVRFATFPFST